ncbi:hypothetical protein HII36_43490, partial [Nonomuraea sp. NN258]|uniref:hypothetical protein n=1 Tax=Nonomuraea antri TaxID=2730852 RepID=UPI00156966C8
PGRQIVQVSPGDYAGSCIEPVPYHAVGSITLPAGAAQTVTAWWIIDGVAGPKLDIPFPAATQPRAYLMNSRWSLDGNAAGAHAVGLMVQGGPAQPDTRSYTFTCDDGPNDAILTLSHIQITHYGGDCDNTFAMNMGALFMTDRPAEVKYRLIADDHRGPILTRTLKPGVTNTLSDFWNQPRQSGSGSSTARIEVLNHNKPVAQQTYSWTCEPKDPNPGTVRIGRLKTSAHHGDCTRLPQQSVWTSFYAAPGTEISYRWVIDGKPGETQTRIVGEGGFSPHQHNWRAQARTGGTVAVEVLNHNKPTKQGLYQVHCT